MRRSLLRLTCLCLPLFAASPAVATLLKPLDLPQLVARSTHIVYAQVIRSESAWWGGRIVTRFTLAPIEAVKGGGAELLDVEVLGGSMSGFAQRVSGAPQLRVGEHVVAFLDPARVSAFKRKAPRPAWRVVGMKQGLFKVDVQADGPKLVRDLDGLEFLGERPGDEGALPLADLLARVSAEVYPARPDAPAVPAVAP
ncbi:hypothetical protein KKF91_07745 [Myxococcota bacterium]|nr:hypothetical protein [Myxococcota bacterium]